MLSLALGIPVGELQGRITASEFAEYLAYYSTEPFGDLRTDFQTGIVASMLQNVILGLSGSKHKPAEPIDFVIHGDAKPGETVLEPGPPPTPGRPAVVSDEVKRKSQEDQIAAIKRFQAIKKKRKG